MSSLFELFVTYVIDNLWAIYFDVWTVQILIFELQHTSVGQAVFRNIGSENVGERRKLSCHCLLLFLSNSLIHMRFMVRFYSKINFQWFKHPIYLVVLSLKSFHVIQVQPSKNMAQPSNQGPFEYESFMHPLDHET